MITKDDIIDTETFAQRRSVWRQEILDIKKNRRVALGSDVTLYFENLQTLLWQIQEMLYIEKGGEAQLEDELAAYAPLVPNGQELVSTVMIEIPDSDRRAMVLAQLGHFEFSLVLRFAGHTIQGVPEDDLERTNADGKTSSVHFIRWPFTINQIHDFKTQDPDIIIECTHPNYEHKAVLSRGVQISLAQDFSKIN